MKNGYTTGACAAAGVKAALLFEAGRSWQTVHLTALDGTELTIPVKAVTQTEGAFVQRSSSSRAMTPTSRMAFPSLRRSVTRTEVR